jgi:beta-glucosidase
MTGFPSDFVWGVATSSYQIEGAVAADGRGESIWDRFTRRDGAIKDASSGAVACDHYHRWAEDIALLQWLGVRAYRFSIAWPRVQPSGRGPINEGGLGFYDRLVDALLAAGIAPAVTLYHWDLPQALEDQGGWTARDVAEAFVEYADKVTRRLGDRVPYWITHNEPWCASVLGYADGVHAPGRQSWPDAMAAAHHLLLSHGWAVPVIRRNAPAAQVGITLNLTPAVPGSAAPADLEACRAFDGGFNRWFLDPLFGRGYPSDIVALYERVDRLPRGLDFVAAGDLASIAAPLDFLGVNYYSRAVVVADEQGLPRGVDPAGEVTDIGWEVWPEGMHQLLLRVAREYEPRRIVITENGAAYGTGPDQEGRVPDRCRVRYLHGHLEAVQRARAEGAPIEGYFLWSLIDNFEWAEGYTQRFGIVWVDFADQRRIAKDSAHWYRQVATTGQLPAPS